MVQKNILRWKRFLPSSKRQSSSSRSVFHALWTQAGSDQRLLSTSTHLKMLVTCSSTILLYPSCGHHPLSHNLINLVAQKAHREIMLLFVLEMSEDGDIVSLVVPETAQKIVHCLVGKDLFVDKTWCMVKKTDILEDIAIEDSNSPFVNLTQQILVCIIFL